MRSGTEEAQGKDDVSARSLNRQDRVVTTGTSGIGGAIADGLIEDDIAVIARSASR